MVLKFGYHTKYAQLHFSNVRTFRNMKYPIYMIFICKHREIILEDMGSQATTDKLLL